MYLHSVQRNEADFVNNVNILFLFVLIYYNATNCVRKYPVEVYKSGYEVRHLVRSLFSEVV